jgi:isoleucyl-tRNA synthetase
VASELNVHSLESLDAASGELVTYTVKPEFRALGRRFGPSTQDVSAVIRATDPVVLAHAVAAPGGSATVPVPSVGEVTLTAADLVVTQTPLSGWGVASGGGETVALDLAVSDALRAEGYAREVVRLIQDARKSAGLIVSDRIVVRWASPDPDLAAALEAHGAFIAGEVLAVSLRAGLEAGAGSEAGLASEAGARGEAGPGSKVGAGGEADGVAVSGPWHEYADADLGLRFWLAVTA